MQPATIPLALYIHIPWCVQKCPYCDFNSHSLKQRIDEDAYINHLLADFDIDYALNPRPIHSIFIGGGTPSLFSGASIACLLGELRQRADFADNIEITLEANPGTFEQAKFNAYRQAGVNRLSLGIQSFSPQQLRNLGRIHDDEEAHKAIIAAQQAGFERINTDLMFGLPHQSPEQALQDLKNAAAYGCEHLSWYQLTLEPNTAFYHHPPPLPDEDQRQDIFEQGAAFLRSQGFMQYETSAWTRGAKSAHNLNYWQFGDYLGIGAGAHGKISLADGSILRRSKFRAPNRYQAAHSQGANPYQDQEQIVAREEQGFEFMMNALRLKDGVARAYLPQRTALQHSDLVPVLETLIAKKLIADDPQIYRCTAQGYAFLNDVLTAFL